MKKKIIIIDGNSLLFRAYYATAYGDPNAIMRTTTGIPTNAVFAFSNMFSKILKDINLGDSLFVGFDADGHTFRREQYEEYKANRKPAPEELIPQFTIAREYLDSIGIKWYEEIGIEADDICGSIAKLASDSGYDVIIYTSDHDYLQLIDKNTKVSLLKTGLSNIEVYDEAYLFEKMELTPSQIVDYKGLAGDSSDNYPGVPGIGEKTAVKLIKEYGTLPEILAAAPNMKGKIAEKLLNGKDSALMSYDLARIRVDAKLPFALEDCAYRGYCFDEVNAFARKYEMRQLLNRLPSSLKRGTKEVSFSFNLVKELPLESFKNDRLAFSLDIDYSTYHEAMPVGIALSNGEETFYLDIQDARKDNGLISLLANPLKKKIVYDGKASIYALRKLDMKLEGIEEDVLLAGYLLDSSVTSSPSEIYRSFGVDIDGNQELLFSENNKERTAKMAAFAFTSLEKIHHLLTDNDAMPLYRSIELPLMKVLAEMEYEGFPLDVIKLKEIGKNFVNKRNALEEEIWKLSGEKFNINSPKQIAAILYDKLGLKGNKARGTSVQDLSEITNEHPIVNKILEYRKYQKLVSTYIDSLGDHVKEDGKIHSYFNQAQTATGRLSSSSPNLQNISARDEEGKMIRKAFYYPEDNISLLSFDYSQIELRLLAALSASENYISLFKSDSDVHSETARKIFGVDEITGDMRRKAKAVNFAIIYGSSIYGLSEQIGTSPQEAGRIIRNFYSSYPEVGEYLNRIVKTCEQQGYVTTMFGRRRYFREVNDPNFSKREAARRAALNAPIQGSAADLIKIAMVKAFEFLTINHYQTKMVLQIHDELIFAVPDNEMEIMKVKLKEIMENAVNLAVPLKVSLGEGKTWYDAKD